MKTKIAVLSAPPELEIEEKFFNKACCLLPDLGICDFIHLPEKGLSRYDCVRLRNFLCEFRKENRSQS